MGGAHRTQTEEYAMTTLYTNPINDLRRIILALEDTRPDGKRTVADGGFPVGTWLVVRALRDMAGADERLRQLAVRELFGAVGALYATVLETDEQTPRAASHLKCVLERLLAASHAELLAWNDVATMPLRPTLATGDLWGCP
jgi:hypothetical protein